MAIFRLPIVARSSTISFSNYSIAGIIIIFKNTIDIRINRLISSIINCGTIKNTTVHAVGKGCRGLMTRQWVLTISARMITGTMQPKIQACIRTMPSWVTSKWVVVVVGGGVVLLSAATTTSSVSSAPPTTSTTAIITTVILPVLHILDLSCEVSDEI